jgi:hypothetical protein
VVWEYSVRMPGRWINRQEALSFLGISEARFDALLASGWLRSRGKGNGRRYDAETVYAVAVLWDQIDPLLSDDGGGGPAAPAE